MIATAAMRNPKDPRMSRKLFWRPDSRGLTRPTIRALVFAALVLVPLAAIYVAGLGIYQHYTAKDLRFVQARQLRFDGAIDVQARKKAFFDFMRPIVVAENQRITQLRSRLVVTRKAGRQPAWVAATAKDYGIAWTGTEWQALLQRVDIVPLPLALAQSANESNWGQSRFAQQGNNMFGQWCFRKGCGMVPKQRKSGQNHAVARYDTVNASVRAYMKNINTGAAYKDLRQLRRRARKDGEAPNAMLLAAGLARYSERGAAYVNDIRAMIGKNRALMADTGAGR